MKKDTASVGGRARRGRGLPESSGKSSTAGTRAKTARSSTHATTRGAANPRTSGKAPAGKTRKTAKRKAEPADASGRKRRKKRKRKRRKCWGPHPGQHIKKCRPTRPLCRWRRMVRWGLCSCGAYHYSHRWGSGFCEHNPKRGAVGMWELLDTPMRGGTAIAVGQDELSGEVPF